MFCFVSFFIFHLGIIPMALFNAISCFGSYYCPRAKMIAKMNDALFLSQMESSKQMVLFSRKRLKKWVKNVSGTSISIQQKAIRKKAKKEISREMKERKKETTYRQIDIRIYYCDSLIMVFVYKRLCYYFVGRL